MIWVGTAVAPPLCGLAPTMVNGKVRPANANELEKCGTLAIRCCSTAAMASGEILLAASKRGCAPWFCRNPISASMGVRLDCSTGAACVHPAEASTKDRLKPSTPRRIGCRERIVHDGSKVPSKSQAVIFFQPGAFVDPIATLVLKLQPYCKNASSRAEE